MKKSAKFFTAVAAVTLASGLVLPCLGGNAVFADPAPVYDFTTSVEDFTVNGFDTDYVIGKDSGAITVPEMVAVGGGTVAAKRVVYDPSNRVVALDADGKFTPSVVGDYRVEYYMESGDIQLKLCDKVIKVTKSGFYFEFPTNTDRIIPSEMNLEVSQKIKDQGFDGTIKLPIPEVYSSETKEKVDTVIVPALTKKPAGSNAVIDNNTIKPDKVGQYVITYTYSAGGVKAVSKQFIIDVNSTYENDYELNYSFSTSKPTSAVLGVGTELPKVTGTNKSTGENVDVYYTVKITKDGVDKTSVVLKDGVFTPNEVGDYNISYTIKNVFGTQAKTFDWTIKDVKDTQDPVVYFGVKEGDEIIDQSSFVPTKYGTKNILLPAIYATDNSGAAITYKREVYRVKTTTLDQGTIGDADSKKILVLNYDEATFATDHPGLNIDDCIVYDKETFSAGIYSVSYVAIDAGGLDSIKSYTMELSDTYVAATPEIEFSTVLPKEVMKGDSVTFDKPTAEDENDERMVVRTYYRIDYTGAWIELENDTTDGRYTIEANGSLILEIKVETENDSGVVGTLTRNVKIIDIDDTTVPTMVSINKYDDVNAEKAQFSEIALPEIVFEDDNAKYLNAIINVVDKDGKQVVVSGKKISNVSDTQIKISDAKFKAAKSGQYTVTYVLSDISGNVLVYSFKTNAVVGTVAPSIVNPIFEDSIQSLELGQSLVLPIPSVKNGDGEDVVDPTYTIDVVTAEGEYAPIISNKFTPKNIGKYVIQYVVEDTTTGLTTKSALYTINVQNTDAPVITNVFDEVVPQDKNTTFVIPHMTVSTDGINDVDWSKTQIEVILNGSTYKTLKLDEKYSTEADETEAYKYTFLKDGTYTFKYTAVDIYGNTNTASFDVKVGDVVAPILTLDEAIDFSDRLVGSTLVIDPGKITANDDVDGDLDKFEYLKVVVKNTSTNEVISNKFKNETTLEGFEYKLDEVGAYEVTFTLKDKAGNTKNLVKTFNVTAEEAKKEFPTEVVGIILLVLACLVLGGVVAYFIISRKKAASPEQFKKEREKKAKVARKRNSK